MSNPITCVCGETYFDTKCFVTHYQQCQQAARAQGGQEVEPVAYRVTGSFTDVPFKDESSAKAYCRGLLSSDPEGGYKITPLVCADTQPAQQDMYRRLANKYRRDLFACQDELNNLRSEYHNRMAELEGEIEELRSAQQGSVPEGSKLVPFEPTEAMLNAADQYRRAEYVMDEFRPRKLYQGIYRAMLAATPQPAQQGSVPEGSRLVTVKWLKRIHRDLDACQKVIWANLQGCDPAYYKDAQERLAEIDAMLAATPQPEGDGWIPEMDDDVRWILGRPNFACAGIAQRLRDQGQYIKRKAEDEQAAAIHWMLGLHAKHGRDWKQKAKELLSKPPVEQEGE